MSRSRILPGIPVLRTGSRPGYLLVTLFLILVALPDTSAGRSWYKYESPYFIAYSDASEKRTLAILNELELFRAAAFQVANIRVPEGALKPQVLIFSSRRDFRKLDRGRNVGAFATHLDGRFHMVLPAPFGQVDTATEYVRHEYGHVLLGYKDIPFPQWYEEGFAELASTIRFRDENTAFIFGEPPPGTGYASGTDFNWNDLISDGWRNSELGGRKVHAAYVQSWLLTHYVMLGDDFKNEPKFVRYIELLRAGEPSLAAFEQAFGMDGNQLWARKLRHYSANLRAFVFDFDSSGVKTEFERSDAQAESTQLVKRLRGLQDPVRAMRESVNSNILLKHRVSIKDYLLHSGMSEPDVDKILFQFAADATECVVESLRRFADSHSTTLEEMLDRENRRDPPLPDDSEYDEMKESCVLAARDKLGIRTRETP